MQSPLQQFYEILGVTETTPISQIRLARKRLLASIHPDRFELLDPRRAEAEERAKLINEAFQGIRESRAVPQKDSRPASPAPAPEPAPVKKTRRRLETVESRIVVRDGKVVMIKRKRAVKFGRLKDIRDSAREMVLTSLDVIEGKLAEKKARRELAQSNLNIGRRVSRVVHIVNGKVSVQEF